MSIYGWKKGIPLCNVIYVTHGKERILEFEGTGGIIKEMCGKVKSANIMPENPESYEYILCTFSQPERNVQVRLSDLLIEPVVEILITLMSNNALNQLELVPKSKTKPVETTKAISLPKQSSVAQDTQRVAQSAVTTRPNTANPHVPSKQQSSKSLLDTASTSQVALTNIVIKRKANYEEKSDYSTDGDDNLDNKIVSDASCSGNLGFLEALCIYHGIDPSHVDEVAKGLTLFFNEWKRYKKDQ
jgi:hypothetical protein